MLKQSLCFSRLQKQNRHVSVTHKLLRNKLQVNQTTTVVQHKEFTAKNVNVFDGKKTQRNSKSDATSSKQQKNSGARYKNRTERSAAATSTESLGRLLRALDVKGAAPIYDRDVTDHRPRKCRCVGGAFTFSLDGGGHQRGGMQRRLFFFFFLT